jgi:ribosomal protein S18 acetylase RimI-like enzyme
MPESLSEPQIKVIPNPQPDDLKRVGAGLVAYNNSQVASEQSKVLLLSLESGTGELLGGLYGYIFYSWLHIDVLWVAESLRRQRQGSRLLERAEAFAREHGCHSCWLDTFSFQARGFYEKHGYAVFGELPNYPGEHHRYFLSKKLV